MDHASGTLSGNAPAHSAIRHIASRLRRVASMSMAEAGYRGWQESAKWIDRRRLGRVAVDPTTVLRREAPAIADHTPAREAIDAVFHRRFFAGVTRESIAEFCRLFPDASREIVDDASALLDGEFNLLGYRGLSFGTPIDWQLDPVWSRRAPMAHWSQIDPLDPTMVGDSKIAWELSRHQWVVRLAQAFAVTGDGRYATAAVEAIEHWIDVNPVGRGLNWASSLEVGFRLIAWTWVLALLRDSTAISPAFTAKLFASIHAHASHVRKYLSYYFSPNTHLTGEALGLFYAGTMFPHFRDAADWRATGARILIEQSRIQISDDGVYFEQSTCYQRYTCEFYLHFLLLAARSGMAIPNDVPARLSRMIEFLVSMRRPDGSMPLVGDADDGCLMPLVRRQPDDFRGVFAVFVAMFRRPDNAAASGEPAPEVLWLLGPDGLRQVIDSTQRRPAPIASRVFDRGGYAVMRSGWDRDAHQLILDVGPLGCHVSSGHGHEDLLAIQCSAFGDRVLIDPGTYGYTAEPAWRNYFRSAAAHSTVTIDRLGQSEPSGPFGWRRRPRAVLREWITTPACDVVDAEHSAYAHLTAPVMHRRRVVFVKPDFWVVIDDLTGTGSHSVELTFQCAPLHAELTSDACRVDTERGSVLWILPFANVPIANEIRSGEVEPIRGWISERYGHKQPAPALVCSAHTQMPMRAITVLYPTRDRNDSPPGVETLCDNGSLIGVLVSGRSVRLDRDRVVITHH
jgi:hypothetical protein